jgi:hypothetical protein
MRAQKPDNNGMNFNRVLIPVGCIALTLAAWRAYQWPGVALVASGLVVWLLLHFTRMLTVLKRAADRPVGSVASAVMLNAKLREGVNLMHVIAMTRSLGVLQSEKDTQPEVFRWTDEGDSHVTCTFVGGKLTEWVLFRPEPASDPSPETVK